MKKFSIDAMLFIMVISVLGLANLFNFNKQTVSSLENRNLKSKPEFSVTELFSGRFLKDFEEYYSDTFILRDNLVKASRDFKDAAAFLGPNISIVTAYEDIQLPQDNGAEKDDSTSAPDIKNDQEEPEYTPGTAESASQAPAGNNINVPVKPEPEEVVNQDFGDGQNVGYWLVVDGKAVQLFKFKKESFEYYSQVLNKFSEKLGSSVKLYSMIPPTASEFMQLKKYAGITDSQNDALGFLKSKLKKEISSVNVYDALNSHKDEYIYFRTDHHWTALGAYYAYSSFMKGRGEEPEALDKYEAIDLGDFLGSSYTKTLDKSLEKNPDNIIAYKPFTNYEYIMHYGDEEKRAEVIDLEYAGEISDKYLTFISSGGATWSVIKTDVKNNKKILVIKDSFGNALVPFLLPHYEEIYIVDSRFYSINSTGKNIVQFIQDNGITEVLFVIYMEDVNWHKFMSGVDGLLGK